MRFPYENDHVRNLANFDSFLSKIMGYGKPYKPAKKSIQFSSLLLVSQNTKVALSNVELLTNQHIHYTNLREVAFESLKKMNLDILNVLQLSCNISETEMYMLVGSGKIISYPFASQQRYDFLLENFSKIIKMLKVNPLYVPKRNELQLANLEDFYALIYLRNNEVKRNNALLSNACLIRNEVMYREHNGLMALATTAKMYIKYHYGWESLEFKQVAELLIKKAKDRTESDGLK